MQVQDASRLSGESSLSDPEGCFLIKSSYGRESREPCEASVEGTAPFMMAPSSCLNHFPRPYPLIPPH